jgi:hypothetical protein
VIDKKKRVKEAIELFEKTDKLAGDYLQLFIDINPCICQGSDLLWSEIFDIINETLTELYG